MKEIIKASVAGYAFTFEKEAYSYLNIYLNEIESHFSQKEDGKEIIGDIEERMSELLRLDIGDTDRVVTLDDVRHLVSIMGKPSDMDEDESASTNAQAEKIAEPLQSEASNHKKRLYRDKDGAVIGGVLSGLANYFQIDKVLLRVIFLLLLVFGHKFAHGLDSTLVLAYVILWIAVPSAKTIQQKLAMSGKDASISDIEEGNRQPLIKEPNYKGKKIGDALKIILSVFLFIISAGFIAVYVLGFFFPSIFNLPSLRDFLEIVDFSSPDIVGLIAAVSIIPVLFIIYIAIRLITGFKSKDGMFLGITFVVWVTLCSYLGVLGLKYASNYKKYAMEVKQYEVSTPSDTIHIRLADEFKNATDCDWGDDNHSRGNIKQIDANTKAWFIIPHVEIVEDSTANEVQIKVNKKAFAPNLNQAKEKVSKSIFDVQQHDSLVSLKPHIYSLKNHWDREVFDVTVIHPKGKTVVLDDILKDGDNFDIEINLDND